MNEAQTLKSQATDAGPIPQQVVAEALDAIPDHIAILDEDGKIMSVNHSWLSFHEQYLQPGLSISDVIGEHYLNFYRPISVASDKNGIDLIQGIEAVLKNEILSCKTEYRISVTPSRWFLFTVKSLGDSNSVIVIESNITETKESDQMREEFVSVASHELKTPITSLKGLVHILQLSYAKQFRGEFPKLVATMEHQLNKLHKIIGDLMVINTPKNAAVKLYVEQFNFRQLLKETVQAVKSTSQMHFFEIKENPNVNISGDKFKLEQVITNLLTNAIKYSPQSNKIIVSSVVDENQLVLSVKDFGKGIEKDKIEHVFQRYYRVKQNGNASGLGLGLYIASEIIKAHHGKIWVESEYGNGSTFYFSLPLFNVLENL